jgi:hypothetical protein
MPRFRLGDDATDLSASYATLMDPNAAQLGEQPNYDTALAIAESQAGAGGTGGGVGQGQKESYTASGSPGLLTQAGTAAGNVVSGVENTLSSLWGTVTAIPAAATTLITWTPYVLFGLAALAVYLFVPKGGSYSIQGAVPRRRRT